VDFVLLRIGVQPNSELARGLLDLDESGHIVVDHLCRTSSPGIFAAGDVANPHSPTISTATGTATTAAKSIYHLSYSMTRL
jgi:thioredoxin reductase (NADPH)